MLRLGLVYRSWPLSVAPDGLSASQLATVIERTDALLAREQGRVSEKFNG